MALMFSAVVFTSNALSCLPCRDVTCPPVYQLRCSGGLVYDACKCCAACAKVKGEKCGGPWNISGVCDCGLRCFKGRKGSGDINAEGICVPRNFPYKG